MTIRPAKTDDLKALISLLQQFNLPTEDIDLELGTFVVAEDNFKCVATAGYQTYGTEALLRSFAVAPSHRSQGIAVSLYQTLQTKAQEQGIQHFYLLTETAGPYFETLGFNKCARDQCPQSIRHTEQFSSLCPQSAATYFKELY